MQFNLKWLLCILAFFTIRAAASDAHPAAAPAKPSPAEKDSKAFQERMQKMAKLDEKVRSTEEAFQKLVLKKREAHSSEEKIKIIEEMKAAYADYSKSVDELVEIKKEIRYRFPSEGEIHERGYTHLEKKSPDELEKTVDLSTTLSNAKMAVDEKYKSFMPAKPAASKAEKKKHEPTDAASQKIRLER